MCSILWLWNDLPYIVCVCSNYRVKQRFKNIFCFSLVKSTAISLKLIFFYGSKSKKFSKWFGRASNIPRNTKIKKRAESVFFDLIFDDLLKRSLNKVQIGQPKVSLSGVWHGRDYDTTVSCQWALISVITLSVSSLRYLIWINGSWK